MLSKVDIKINSKNENEDNIKASLTGNRTLDVHVIGGHAHHFNTISENTIDVKTITSLKKMIKEVSSES